MTDEVGLYDKYRVIPTAELNELAELGEMMSEQGDERYQYPIEIVKWVETHSLSGDDPGTAMVFVLRPDHDYHARVALAAYAESVRAYNSSLADDLAGALQLMDPPTKMEPD